MARPGEPEILNTDQGSQFTGAAFTRTLINHGIAVSMAPARAPLIDAENLFRQSGQPQSAARIVHNADDLSLLDPLSVGVLSCRTYIRKKSS